MAANTSNMNLDISSYTLNELFDLLGIDVNFDGDILTQQIFDKASIMITHLNSKNNTKLADFYKQVRDTILQQTDGATENESILVEEEGSGAGDLIQSDPRNQIKRQVLRKMVNIDSRFRQSGVSHNFSYQLPEKINNITSMHISSFEIPISWYQISSHLKNNIFTVTLVNLILTPDSEPENISYNIVVPDVNYTLSEIKTTINNMLYNFNDDVLNPLRCVVFDTNLVSKKTSFEINSTDVSFNPFDPSGLYYSPDFEFNLNFTGAQPNHKFIQSLGYLLGYRNTFYNINRANNTEYSLYDFKTREGVITSEAIYQSSVYDYVFLILDENTGNYVDPMVSEYGSVRQILLRAQTNPEFDRIFGVEGEGGGIVREYLGPKTISTIKVHLADAYGNDVNLNNAEFSFTLCFTQKYTN
jgi:hypothetical protein